MLGLFLVQCGMSERHCKILTARYMLTTREKFDTLSHSPGETIVREGK